MSTYPRSPAGGRPWVDRLAGHINDPIMRLRFLKTVAPHIGPVREARWRRLPRLRLLVAAALGTALAVAVMLSLVPLSWPRTRVPTPGASKAVPVAVSPHGAEPGTAADVWLVEKSGEAETYSNGLRIDNHFLITTHQRRYLAFPVNGGSPSRRTALAGVVFHTTESPQAPFEADENRTLKKIGESLLEYVRRIRAYNFVIDRFGRVYRVVAEDQAANHSGFSVWADENWSYINLNESFLGISFEAVSRPAQQESQISPAQVRSAAMLIEMVRSRYQIPAANFVTHAQVSVNPTNMRGGMHIDWAAGFPFEAVGLPDNYAAPLPALWCYGFDYDASFKELAGARMRAGLDDAAAKLAQKAAAAGLRAVDYKTRMRQRYRKLLAEVRRGEPE